MNDKERLEQIIDLETPLAEAGCLTAQSLVINAQAELDQLNQKEAKGIIIVGETCFCIRNDLSS